VPADANDIHQEYRILLNELQKFNPELLQKKRILAISKSDLLDDELEMELAKDLPEIPHLFISSHNQKGLMQLKDIIWKNLNS
jgi:GTP-binding protein